MRSLARENKSADLLIAPAGGAASVVPAKNAASLAPAGGAALVAPGGAQRNPGDRTQSPSSGEPQRGDAIFPNVQCRSQEPKETNPGRNRFQRLPGLSFAALLVSFALISTAQAQSIRYVDDDAPAGGDGTTWSTAYKYLQDALAAAAGELSGGLPPAKALGQPGSHLLSTAYKSEMVTAGLRARRLSAGNGARV